MQQEEKTNPQASNILHHLNEQWICISSTEEVQSYTVKFIHPVKYIHPEMKRLYF